MTGELAEPRPTQPAQPAQPARPARSPGRPAAAVKAPERATGSRPRSPLPQRAECLPSLSSAFSWLSWHPLVDCFGAPPPKQYAVFMTPITSTPRCSDGSRSSGGPHSPSTPTTPVADAGVDAPKDPLPALTLHNLHDWLRCNARPPLEVELAPPPRFRPCGELDGRASEQTDATALQHAGHIVAEVYAHIIGAGCWDANFSRGLRPYTPGNRFQIHRLALGLGGGPPVRRLATAHIGPPATDGWNVIAAALELVRCWALPAALPPLEATQPILLLDRATRMRIAACLATAWHFQRNNMSRFPREYASDLSRVPGSDGSFSFELARVAYLCLYECERRRLGPWPIDVVVEMQTCILGLQIELMVSTPTFGLMVRNPQVRAEERLFDLLDDPRSLLTVHAALTARAVLPFFVRNLWLSSGASLYVDIFADRPTLPANSAAAALACAAWVVTSEPSDAQAEHVCAFFALCEMRYALAIIGAVAPVANFAYTHNGCFASPSFFAAPCLAHAALDRARARLLRTIRAYSEVWAGMGTA